MSKLLARAKVKLINAKNDYYNLSIDDAYADDCCYNLQQTIEYCLKYMVEMNGENYVENHDIRAQLNKLDNLNVKLKCFDDIRHIATTLNDWQTQTRYNDDFIATKQDIDEALAIAEKLISYCDDLVEKFNNF